MSFKLVFALIFALWVFMRCGIMPEDLRKINRQKCIIQVQTIYQENIETILEIKLPVKLKMELLKQNREAVPKRIKACQLR